MASNITFIYTINYRITAPRKFDVVPSETELPNYGYIEIIGKFRFFSEPVISKNITNSPKVQISRWYPNPGKNTDITFFKGRSILHRFLQYLQF